MTYKELKSKLKTELKQMAKDIRFKKDKRKFEPDGYIVGLYSLREEFRIQHLAYCMLRGTPYKKIEPKHAAHQDVRGYKKGYIAIFEYKYIKEKADKLLASYRDKLESENVA